MKKSVLLGSVLMCLSAFAVDGYKDIYVQNDQDIYVHTIYCAENLSNLSKLKPSVVYTNTKDIEKGTYYFNSVYGTYSSTFNTIKGQSKSVRVRGLLTKGQTLKSQMKKDICLVEKNSELPKGLNRKIQKDILKSNDPSWNQKMKRYMTYFGTPAYAKGKYLKTK